MHEGISKKVQSFISRFSLYKIEKSETDLRGETHNVHYVESMSCILLLAAYFDGQGHRGHQSFCNFERDQRNLK